MSIRTIALASAAVFALSAGVGVAQADEQDDAVRQLNIEQLEKAKSGDTMPTPMSEPATEQQDGQGGPEFQGPPTPDEGMTDDEPTDEPSADDQDNSAPDADEPAEDDQPEAPKPE